MGYFTLLIQDWYRQNGRDLPWRHTKNAYKIWLSEVVLQQTRVDQGTAYYHKLLKSFPNVQKLAAADEQEVLKNWQGLGYYSRARNLHKAAQQIVDLHNGIFPSEYKNIRELKGVGDYTAAAISSFAFGLVYPVVDGNVYRLLSRFYNDSTPIDTGAGRKVFLEYAENLIDPKNPANFNQAIMELGALVCKPKNPDCISCPLNETCEAYRNGNPLLLPVKSKKVKVSKQYFHYFIFPSDKIELEKRTGKGIWKNMFQFPLIMTEAKANKVEVSGLLNKKYGVNLIKKISSERHMLTHQHIEATFWSVDQKIGGKNHINVDLVELIDYPLPRLIDRFIEEHTHLFV